MKNITLIDAAEVLMNVFARLCTPKQMLSDNGLQFTSDMMYQGHLVGIKPLFTTSYHRACNGEIERQHRILKAILKVQTEHVGANYIPGAFFAVREIPFSPFELLYERRVRGPCSNYAPFMRQLFFNYFSNYAPNFAANYTEKCQPLDR